MPAADVNLKAEIARVQGELTFFRQECLPAFLGEPVQDLLHDGMSDFLKGHIVTLAGRLSDWQGAATRLAEYLPLGPLPPDAPALGREDFGRFLFQQAAPAFTVRAGRIVWRVGLFVTLEWALRCPVFAGEADDGRDEWERFLGRVAEVKRWLLALPADNGGLGDPLCVLLPFVAEADPAFVKLALDAETWRCLVRTDRSLSDEQRARRLKFLDSFWFGHILNNALLHVLGGLANNHCLSIRDYLDHPNLRGSYTHLMPHYLFAVFFEKVAALRRLAQEQPERRA